MNTTAQELYATAKEAHETMYKAVAKLKLMCTTLRDVNELADISYALMKAEALAADSAKDMRLFKEIVDRALCVLWVQANDPNPIRTEYVTASPKVKMMASLPRSSNDPENYRKLMDYLGVKPEFSGAENCPDIVRPHWPGFVEYVTQCVEQGRPLPPGISVDKTYPVYHVTMRAKKGVCE